MFKLVLFYCACQLVIQSFLYFSFRGYLKRAIYNTAYTFNWSRKKIIKYYNIIGLVINSLITALAIMVTARASMVGTANLLASTILTVLIYLDSLTIAYTYTFYKQKKDLLRKEKKQSKNKSFAIQVPSYLLENK